LSGVVIDTHVLIWLMQGDQRLGAIAKKTIQTYADQEEVFVPAIVCWEVAMLASKGRIKLGCGVQQRLEQVFELPGVNLTDLSPTMAVDSTRLPGEIHGDPADRLVVATARAVSAQLVTADQKILTYALAGHVGANDARQ